MTLPLLPKLRSLLDDRTAAVGIIGALILPIVIGFAGFAVDVGLVYNARSTLQGVGDLAGTAAVADLSTAPATVRRIFDDNGLPDASFTLTTGRYNADLGRLPQARFVAGATPANALMISASAQSPAYFSRLFHDGDYTVEAQSLATREAAAAFSLTSELASVDNPVLDALTGAVIGGGVHLDVLDSRSLASVGVTGNALSSALAKVGSLDSAARPLDRTYSLAKFLTAAGDATALRGELAATGVLRRLARDAFRSDVTVRPSDILTTPSGGTVAVSPGSALGLDVGLLDLVQGSLRPRGDGSVLSTTLTVPGLAGVSLDVLLQDPVQKSGPIAVGGPGAITQTAQLRARLKVTIGDVSNLPVKLVDIALPVEIVAAAAKAELVRVDCPADPARRTATLRLTPGLAKIEFAGWAGSLAQAGLDRSPLRADIAKAGVILGTPLLNVTGRGVVPIEQTGGTEVTFTMGDVNSHRVKSVGTTTLTGSLLSGLASIDLDAEVLGIRLIGLGGLLSQSDATRAVAALMTSASVTGPLDSLLSGVLAYGGISVGKAQAQVTAIGCGMARIAG